MFGWIVPPPREPRESRDQLRCEREAKVRLLEREGLVCSARAVLTVRREDLIPPEYRDHAYE